MRISDWSSDVCSSDLEGRRDENLRALTGRRVSPAPFIGVIDDAAAVQHVAVFVVSEGRCIDGHRTIRVVIDARDGRAAANVDQIGIRDPEADGQGVGRKRDVLIYVFPGKRLWPAAEIGSAPLRGRECQYV